MNRLSTILISASLVFAAVVSAAAQREEKPRPWGWDLTYSSLLEKDRSDGMTSLGQDLSYCISRVVDEWKGDPIRSSVLVEMPSNRGSGWRSLWFVRTRSKAYFWEFDGVPDSRYQQTEIDKNDYDRLFRSLDSVKQSKPRIYQNPRMNWKGYYGALSTANCVSSNCPSKQILLTWEDFYPLDSTETKSAGSGPVAAALDRTFAEMSATDLLLFRTCKDQPSLKDFTPVEVRTAHCGFDSGKSKCFRYRGHTFGAEFTEEEKLSAISQMNISGSGYNALRQIMPVDSWFSMILRSPWTQPIVPDPAQKYSSSIFEDECVSIEFRVWSGSTALVWSGWRLRWKDRSDR